MWDGFNKPNQLEYNLSRVLLEFKKYIKIEENMECRGGFNDPGH